MLKKDQTKDFTHYLCEDITWTMEGQVMTELTEEDEVKKVERVLIFLETMSVINEDGSIRTRVYRKETYTDQYLNFTSNHPL